MRKIIHFVSARFDIVGFGENREQLMNEGLVSDISDIFELKTGDLEPLERFAEKSAKILQRLLKKQKNKLGKILYALGIRFVGEETAVLVVKNKEKIIKEKIKSLQDVINIFPQISKEQWMEIKGIGDKSAESLFEWFNDKKNLELLEKIKKLGVILEVAEAENISDGNQKLSGKILSDWELPALQEMAKI